MADHRMSEEYGDQYHECGCRRTYGGRLSPDELDEMDPEEIEAWQDANELHHDHYHHHEESDERTTQT